MKGYLVNRISEVKGLSERTAVLKIEISDTIALAVIQVYAPTSAASEKEIEEFCKHIDTVIECEKEDNRRLEPENR